MDRVEFQGPQGVEPEVWAGSTSGEWVCVSAARATSSLVRGGTPVPLMRVYAIELVRGDESQTVFGCSQCGQVFGRMGEARYHLRRCPLTPEKAAPTTRRRGPRARYFSADFASLTTVDLRDLHKAYLALLEENTELRGLLDDSIRMTRSLVKGVDALREKFQG